MHILLIGPYYGNSKHGAEVGVYDALIELNHKVSVWDHRTSQYKIDDRYIKTKDGTSNNDILKDIKHVDTVLCLGPGLSDEILQSDLFKKTEHCKRILWNSEPIRLKNYAEKILINKEYFQTIFTFDESEIPLYRKLGIDAIFLPQAFNPKWYNPIKMTKSQKFPNTLCFIGSIGGKWGHRQLMLNRVLQSGISAHIATIFDATKVNQAYNMHDGVLNLGLYCEECGDPKNLTAFGLQQRIFESIGAGKICITNEIDSKTNKLFQNGKHILQYNANNLEDVCKLALDKKTRDGMEEEILKIREDHTYKSRMISMFEKMGE